MAKMPSVDLQKLVAGLELLRDDVADAQADNMPGNPSLLWRLTHLEPSIYSGGIVAVVAILGAVGLVVSGHDVASATTVVGGVLSMIQALWTRKQSTANAKVVVYKPDPINAPTKVAAGSASSSDAVAVVNAAAPVAVLPFIAPVSVVQK